ncbi:MAG TPA: AMP-binding protein, partial [Acetobacteraceae bacterium]|nr:AMP-binding protein [Acetobacteraceae bacterium]
GRSRHWLSTIKARPWGTAGGRAEAEQFAASNLFSFLLWLRLARRRTLADGEALAGWAEEDPDGFGAAFWDFAQLIGERGRAISLAENVLLHRGEREAVVGRLGGALSRERLREEAFAFAAGLRALGVRPGDAVGGWTPDSPEAVAAFLGANAIGAIWSCKPDAAQFPLEKQTLARFAGVHRGAALSFMRQPLAEPLAILEDGAVERQTAFPGHLHDILLRAEVRPDELVKPEPPNGWLWGVAALATGARLGLGWGAAQEATLPGPLRAETPRERAPRRR